VTLVQIGWIGRLWVPAGLGLSSFIVLALLELAVPAVAERAGVTPYHPRHIAERYGLFTLIVLGESVTSVVVAIEAAIHQSQDKTGLIGRAAAGLIILFAMWWLYFDKSAVGMLDNLRSSLVWGYGHYLIFASIAAVGAGLNVGTLYQLGEVHVSGAVAGFALTVPVAVFLVVVWALHLRHRHTRPASASFPIVSLLILGSTFTGDPLLAAAILIVLLVVITVVTSRSRMKPAGSEVSLGTAGH
jgi:low temperature requirement protein LtrA